MVPLFMMLMFGLNRLNPASFNFNLDFSDLEAQVDGLTWTVTFVLVIFYFLAAFYLFRESNASKIDAQKQVRRGLALLFFFLGFMELMVVLYSLIKEIPGIDIQAIFPDTIPAPAEFRGDTGWALLLSPLAVLYITFAIEKYIKQSNRLILTKLISILLCFGVAALVLSYIPAISGQEWYQIGGYVFIGLSGIGLIFGIIAIPVIYGQLAAQTSGDIKKNALTILFGFLITIISIVLHVLRDMIAFPLNWLVFIVLNIIGVLILIQGILKSTF